MNQPTERKFNIGDIVNYTNSNGVYIGERKITGLDSRSGETYFINTYYLEPTDTPWFSIAEDQLEKIETHESA